MLKTSRNRTFSSKYFLQKRIGTFEAFQKFKALVETQTRVKIKCLQSDNGREYCNQEFNDFLMANGICRRLTVTYTSQQNGVAERKNRTLVEMARCLLIQSNLGDSFWAEAIATANHIRNRCITGRLDGETPYELWKGKSTYLHYLRIFGTRTFVLNKFPGEGKFEARSNKGIFIGYSEHAKAYRV